MGWGGEALLEELSRCGEGGFEVLRVLAGAEEADAAGAGDGCGEGGAAEDAHGSADD